MVDAGKLPSVKMQWMMSWIAVQLVETKPVTGLAMSVSVASDESDLSSAMRMSRDAGRPGNTGPTSAFPASMIASLIICEEVSDEIMFVDGRDKLETAE